jgi:hypothetical protein
MRTSGNFYTPHGAPARQWKHKDPASTRASCVDMLDLNFSDANPSVRAIRSSLAFEARQRTTNRRQARFILWYCNFVSADDDQDALVNRIAAVLP